jgi:hypothetical protein
MLYLQFASKLTGELSHPNVRARSVFRDVRGGTVKFIIFALTLICLIVTSFYNVHVWMVTLPSAILVLVYDLQDDIRQYRRKQQRKLKRASIGQQEHSVSHSTQQQQQESRNDADNNASDQDSDPDDEDAINTNNNDISLDDNSFEANLGRSLTHELSRKERSIQRAFHELPIDLPSTNKQHQQIDTIFIM